MVLASGGAPSSSLAVRGIATTMRSGQDETSVAEAVPPAIRRPARSVLLDHFVAHRSTLSARQGRQDLLDADHFDEQLGKSHRASHGVLPARCSAGSAALVDSARNLHVESLTSRRNIDLDWEAADHDRLRSVGTFDCLLVRDPIDLDRLRWLTCVFHSSSSLSSFRLPFLRGSNCDVAPPVHPRALGLRKSRLAAAWIAMRLPMRLLGGAQVRFSTFFPA